MIAHALISPALLASHTKVSLNGFDHSFKSEQLSSHLKIIMESNLLCLYLPETENELNIIPQDQILAIPLLYPLK